MNYLFRFFSQYSLLLFIASLFFISCKEKKEIDFSSQIKPIINNKCIACHGGVKQNAGFSFLFEQQAKGNTDEGSPAIIPGNAKKSRLIQRLHETDPELRMPYEKPALSKEEIALFMINFTKISYEDLSKLSDKISKWALECFNPEKSINQIIETILKNEMQD